LLRQLHEQELLVRAPTCEGVFAEASEALAEVLGTAGGGSVELRLRVEARDVPALLADWLGELVWLAEQDELIFERLIELRVGETVAQGTIMARPGRPAGLVKAVTYHGLACEPEGEGWRATVVLDV
jgi:SHS2 domain-containing protein